MAVQLNALFSTCEKESTWSRQWLAAIAWFDSSRYVNNEHIFIQYKVSVQTYTNCIRYINILFVVGEGNSVASEL